MVSFRTGELIKKFLKGQKTKKDLNDYIRETRDTTAILFAQRIALYDNFHPNLGGGRRF